MMPQPRRLSPHDRLLDFANGALETAHGPAPHAQRAYPATATPKSELDVAQRRHAAGLMRINHAGEVCAQALYLGQAAVARRGEVREQLLEAAGEEADHLAWCAQRLEELGSAPSALNLFWFAGSFAIGAGAGIVGDALSLGFIVETERQVEAHLGEHLEKLPDPDARSRAVVKQMQEDEARHGANATAAGARELPPPIPRVMAAAAGVMKWLAYRV
jgi:ubiquinone biosynthesis monooxygenase Coq7